MRSRSGRQATGRATLAPKLHKGDWVARGQVPVRGPEGEIASRRIERAFDPAVKTQSERFAACAEMNRAYDELFQNPGLSMTFARAFKLYLRDHEEPMYAREIAVFFGTMPASEIDDVLMDELAA